MLEKINLSLLCLLLVTLFAVQPCLAGGVQIQPDRIILNAEGKSETDTIQASIPMALGFMVEGCEATLTIGEASIEADGYKYCYVDDILHVYFDKGAFLKFLEDNGILGTVEANVAGTVSGEGESVAFEGDDTIEVIDPDKGEGAK
jgi:hypothetical protein